MWWSRTLAILLIAGLAGCGFRPMYGDLESSAAVAPELAQIRVLAIADREGQRLRNDLVQLLAGGREAASPNYTLEVQQSTALEGMGFQKTAEATLGRLTVSVLYYLKDAKGTTIKSGTSRSIVSFNYLGPRYGSIVQERDAEERAMGEVAQDIRRQLSAFFAVRKGQAAQ